MDLCRGNTNGMAAFVTIGANGGGSEQRRQRKRE